MKYDLKTMMFDPDITDVDVMFSWRNTPEGHDYWANYHHNPHQEGRDKITAMLKQWKEEQAIPKDGIFLSRRVSDEELIAMTTDTRPAINVLHQHDGSPESPVPVGTDHTYWLRDETVARAIDKGYPDWFMVTAYLVHSYPKTKQVTGTVTYTNGEPDFKTWAPCTGTNSKP